MKSFIAKLRKSSNFHSLVGNVSFAFFNSITFLLMARTLSKDLFGEWIIYVTAASLLNMLRLGLIGTGAIRLISLAKDKDEEGYIGSAYKLGLTTFLFTVVLFYPAWFILKIYIPESYYYPVLLFYPILSLMVLPYNQATIVTQAKVQFARLSLMKTIHGSSMLILIGLYVLLFEATIEGLLMLHTISNFLPGIPALVKGWDGLKFYRKSTKKHTAELLNFGKYSTLISVGSSLLRSADTFIISMSTVMGAASIAIYAIPMKFVEAVEIPLRSFSATAYPRLSQAFGQGKAQFNAVLNNYNVKTTLAILPIALILLALSEPLLKFVGGAEYYDSLALQKQILYIILVYILLLPSDRYTGVALFALDKPVKNFYKTMMMLVANVVFDLIAVFIFKSLLGVAFATLIFTIIGVYYGWFFVQRETGAKISDLFTESIKVSKSALAKIRSKRPA